MGTLNSKQRNALPSSDFAIPSKREYPIEDRAHAIDAEARAADHPDVKAQVDAAVHHKYPDLGSNPGNAHPNAKN